VTRTRRRTLAGVATAIAIGGAALAEPRPPLPADAGTAEALALADTLAGRLAVIERRLGLAPRGDRDAGLRARYDALRAREAEAAARAEAWLRFVPSLPPVSGGVVTSAFGPRRYHPIRRRVLPHLGLDIAGRAGEPVRAAADGHVLATADHPTYGLTVDLRHGDSGFVTRYAHLSRIGARPGDPVRRGDVIGAVGSTGLSTGPHTHYEVFYRGWRRDPIEFLSAAAVAAPHAPGTVR
jgi:murein DD-endopeptidase MepM/ murein hydrolase activator NlpD